MDTNPRMHARSGQALVEFCIGLVAMLAVIGGVFQLGRMGLARTEARVEATRSATARSMRSSDAAGQSIPNYIHRMDEGGDEATYSVNDRRIGGDEQDVYDRLIAPSSPHLLHTYAPDNDLADINGTLEMLAGMGLVHGAGNRFDIPVLPVVRRLFFDRPHVDIQVSAWMVRTGELY